MKDLQTDLASTPAREPARVLFVDDQAEVVAAVRRGLGGRFTIVTAASGEEARELLSESPSFAVVIADQELTGVSGTEFLAWAREHAPDSVRVLITAHRRFELAEQAVRHGDVWRLLAKPVGLEDLRQVIEDGVEQYELQRTERRLAQRQQFVREALQESNQRLEARVRSQIHRLRTLDDLSRELSSAEGVETIGRLLVDRLCAAFDGRFVQLELQLEPHYPARLRFDSGGLAPTRLAILPVPTNEGEVGRLVVDDRVIAGRSLTADDRKLLSTAATAAGLAIHSQVNRRQRDDAQHATVFALARLAEHRDNETGLHLERVREYCRLAALGLREDGLHTDTITDEWVEDVVLSSALHDIGKVGIPDSVLLKPGKLDEEEWVTMRRHTTIGADTLRSVIEHAEQPSSILQVGLEIAWCHHERWDGGGYPRGIVGDEIPLSARILSVVDCYDALTSKRPYKEPWPHADSIAYLREMSGSQFDPEVVASFVARADQADEIRARLGDDLPASGVGASEEAA